MLRPGGFFVWSATPVYQKLAEDVEIWEGTKFPYVPFLPCYATSLTYSVFLVAIIGSNEEANQGIVLGTYVY